MKDIAEEICSKLLGEPKSHHEWANRFNQVAIIRVILKDPKMDKVKEI